MRLLEKKEITQAQAKDKAQAIAEGLKLTQRIDGLRELQAETEESYQRFREHTLKTIQREIDDKILIKDTLDANIAKKEAEWKKLLEPLDKQWARYVKDEKAKIDALRAEWELKNAETIRQSKTYQELSEQAKETITKNEESTAKLSKEHGRVSKLALEAEQTLANAKDEAQTIVRNANSTALEVRKKEEAVKLYEESVKIHEQTLKQKEEELEKREMDVLIKELRFNSPVRKT